MYIYVYEVTTNPFRETLFRVIIAARERSQCIISISNGYLFFNQIAEAISYTYARSYLAAGVTKNVKLLKNRPRNHNQTSSIN